MFRKALAAVYPEYSWQMFRFHRAPHNHYEDFENVKEAMKYIAEVLQVKEPADWYRVTANHIMNMGFSNLVVVASFPLVYNFYRDMDITDF